MKRYTCELTDVLTGEMAVIASAPEKILVHMGRGNVSEIRNGKPWLMSLMAGGLGIKTRDWHDANGCLTFYRKLADGHQVLSTVAIRSTDIVEKIVSVKEEAYESMFEVCQVAAESQSALTFFESCHDCSTSSICRARAACIIKNPPKPLGRAIKDVLNKKIL